MSRFLFFLVLMSQSSVNASLMFSSQEVSNLLDKRLQNKHKNDDLLECQGVLFQNENSWSVWMNGEKLTVKDPQCHDKTIKILAVDHTHVHLEWRRKGERHLVTLQPNQLYNATLKKVIKPQ